MTSEWSPTQLGHVAEVQSGFAFKSDQFLEDGHVRLARGANVSQGGFDWSKLRYWPTELREGYESFELAPGDVVLAMDRPWIEAGLKYARVSAEDLPALLVQRVARLRARPERMDQGFLYYALGTPKFTQHVLAVQTGTTIPHISGKQIVNYSLLLPPLAEQRAIAEVLSSLDDRIQRNIRLRQTVRAFAAAVGAKAELDGPGVPMSDVARVVRTPIPEKQLKGQLWSHYSIPAYDSAQQPVLTTGDDIKSAKLSVPAPALLLSKLNPSWHRVWPVGEPREPAAICSTEFMPLVPLEGISMASLWSLTLSSRLQSQLLERVTGSTGSHQRVRPKDILACRVADPDNLYRHEALLQALLQQYLRSFDEDAELRRVRGALLPELMSGRLRIEEPQRLLGAIA